MDELTGTLCDPGLLYLPDLILVSSSNAAELFLLRWPKVWLPLLRWESSCANMLPFEFEMRSMLPAVLLPESILKELLTSCNDDGLGEFELVFEFVGLS